MIIYNKSGTVESTAIRTVNFQFRRVNVHVIGQKPYGMSHLHISTLLPLMGHTQC